MPNCDRERQTLVKTIDSGVVPARSHDVLTLRDGDVDRPAFGVLSPDESRRLVGQQKELCMVGDSVTWAEDGDWFRRHLLTLMPELAFLGTHTAVLGYAHAGEGGDATWDILKRVADPRRIPDAPYYHLLAGINDCGGANCPDQVEEVAAATMGRIVTLVHALLDRPGTRKVFLASILPGPFDPASWESTPRDLAGSRTNALLRRDFTMHFPDGRVVWVEYEKPLRKMGRKWRNAKTIRGAHPTAQGYRCLAELAAPALRREMVPTPVAGQGGRVAVEVENLWQKPENASLPLLPGWYVLSFAVDGAEQADFTLFSTGDPAKGRFERHCVLPVSPGCRVELEFMTGYEGYGYTRAAFRLHLAAGMARDIQIEKMRPSRRASRFGEGRFTDAESPVSAGERLLLCP